MIDFIQDGSFFELNTIRGLHIPDQKESIGNEKNLF